jgi:hypothetical protein
VAQLEHAVVLGYLAVEIPPLLDLTRFHGLEASWDEGTLTVSLRLTGRSETEGHTEDYFLAGVFDDYRLLPPAWRFLDPRTGANIGAGAYPLGNWFPPEGSVFHGNGLICAPWSRDAYVAHGGPHHDWNDLTAWETVGLATQTNALTLADMFARIYAELQRSEGRMAPLPPVQEAAA